MGPIQQARHCCVAEGACQAARPVSQAGRIRGVQHALSAGLPWLRLPPFTPQRHRTCCLSALYGTASAQHRPTSSHPCPHGDTPAMRGVLAQRPGSLSPIPPRTRPQAHAALGAACYAVALLALARRRARPPAKRGAHAYFGALLLLDGLSALGAPPAPPRPSCQASTQARCVRMPPGRRAAGWAGCVCPRKCKPP